jgi:hypothetical protein
MSMKKPLIWLALAVCLLAPVARAAELVPNGGFVVDIAWQNGKVTNYRLQSKEPREVKVRVNGELKTIRAERL